MSSILSNILSVEGDNTITPTIKTLLNRSSIDESLETLSKKPQRRSKDFDFSSFWKTSDKEQDTTNGEDRKMILKLLEIRHQRKHYPTS